MYAETKYYLSPNKRRKHLIHECRVYQEYPQKTPERGGRSRSVAFMCGLESKPKGQSLETPVRTA